MILNPTYDGTPAETWLNELRAESKYNTKHILSAFAYFGIPATFFDVGCGDGTMVNIARKLGVEAYGVDQLVQPDWPPYFFHHNLVDDFTLPESVDMIVCTEVAEHLHESAHSTFMNMIVKNMKEKSQARLIFTAALPGQDGTGHLAMRPPEYWRREFTNLGLTFHRIDTVNLALLWTNIESGLVHLAANLQVFEK